MKIVSGHPWTIDGRWVVVGQMFEDGPNVIVYDPCNDDIIHPATRALTELFDCRSFVKETS